MSLEDLGLIDYEVQDKTLLLDGDIVIYRPCCIFNEEDDQSKRQIAKYVNSKIDELMKAAGCNKYIMFVTTKFNFRDSLVDDYKANRDDVERPVNLAWAKRWAIDNLNTYFHKGLEADDLLGIHTAEDTVIWSLDKDLRQIPGNHLDDDTMQLVEITEAGHLEERGKKVHFDGIMGLYYQLLVGDSADWIVGCGKRVESVFKSGAKKGEKRVSRKGIGPKGAIKILVSAIMSRKQGKEPTEAALEAVIQQYKLLHKEDWQHHLETQANLLFMVRKQYGEVIQRWTYDGREEYFDLVKGVIINDFTPN